MIFDLFKPVVQRNEDKTNVAQSGCSIVISQPKQPVFSPYVHVVEASLSSSLVFHCHFPKLRLGRAFTDWTSCR